MNSRQAAPTPVCADGGGAHRGGYPGRNNRRRAKNRRYRRNRCQRSHLTIVSWNAEGLRSKIPELQRWLPTIGADVVAVQEGQFPKAVPRLPGYQPPVVVRRARGRIAGAATVKGGDVAVYVKGGLHFVPLTGRHLAAADDTTEVCGVQLLRGNTRTTIINLYRPPIRATEEDDREDHFDPSLLPSDDETIIVGDVNAHHPSWDAACAVADGVGDRIADWMETVEWLPLNSGEATFASYRTGGQSAPDLATCGAALARRARWVLGPDLGSDHLPMVIELRGAGVEPRRIRKPKLAYEKADWVAFRDSCEAALDGAGPPGETVGGLSARFTAALQEASSKFIPRGARADPRPWALDPEFREAAAERREARRLLRSDDQESRTRWLEAKRHAAEVERRVSRDSFRKFVSTTLNRPASLGRVAKILKKWDRSTDDEHRDGQALEHKGRLLVTDRAKAEGFVQTYAHVSRQVRTRKVDREAKKKMSNPAWKHCPECGDRQDGCCGPFKMEELTRHLQSAKLKKASGPDGVSNEMLRHLGPVARGALLGLINASWSSAEVPREWRAATVIPIPKSGKDKKLLSSYRPIALTSCVSKLAERLILARLTYQCELRGLIPPEQVGFREHRSVEDHLGRLIQEVQDGWQQPKARNKSHQDGTTAQKYVLLAFDFARAYDTVDHRLLRVRLLEMGLPVCMTRWVWQWLRDRRARVEVNGVLSSERVFRAGLPQGSVLSPSLFLLWAATLVQALRTTGTSPFMYADDTAALCAGNTITQAKERAQQAADALLHWARRSKMTVSAEKTQMMVLSQWYRDSVDCQIKMAGKTVKAGDTVNILGVTIDRLLHFGPHCRRLRGRARPRVNQLRQLSGRSWGLDENMLRTVANGYVRGAIEHAAAAWLPATPPSHVEVLEREMRAAARVITGCPRSTPTDALVAEAGITPVSVRRQTLAARLLAKATALPQDDPLRRVAEATAPERLSTVMGWRRLGREVWDVAGVTPRWSRFCPEERHPGREVKASPSAWTSDRCRSEHHPNRNCEPPHSTSAASPNALHGYGPMDLRIKVSTTEELECTS